MNSKQYNKLLKELQALQPNEGFIIEKPSDLPNHWPYSFRNTITKRLKMGPVLVYHRDNSIKYNSYDPNAVMPEPEEKKSFTLPYIQGQDPIPFPKRDPS
jgi:hypothetical protein